MQGRGRALLSTCLALVTACVALRPGSDRLGPDEPEDALADDEAERDDDSPPVARPDPAVLDAPDGSVADGGGLDDSASAVRMDGGAAGTAPVDPEVPPASMPLEPVEPASAPDAGSRSPVSAPDAGARATTDAGIRARYAARNTAPSDGVIAPHLQIENVGVAGGVPLGELRLRYYFTNENASSCPAYCAIDHYYAGIEPGGVRVDARRRLVALPARRAYLEISFAPDAPLLQRGQAVELQQQLHTTAWLRFDERDDYSFDPTKTTLTDWSHITVYRGDVLVWGDPPTR